MLRIIFSFFVGLVMFAPTQTFGSLFDDELTVGDVRKGAQVGSLVYQGKVYEVKNFEDSLEGLDNDESVYPSAYKGELSIFMDRGPLFDEQGNEVAPGAPGIFSALLTPKKEEKED